MPEDTNTNSLGQYRSALQTATLAAEQGNTELALEVIQCALRKLYLEKDTIINDSHDEDAQAIDLMLNQRYLEYRSKLEPRSPYLSLAIKSLIIAAIVVSALLLTATVAFKQMRNVMHIAARHVVSQEFRESKELVAIVKSTAEKAVERALSDGRERTSVENQDDVKDEKKRVKKR
ncbi:MAG: hypothetical protein A4E61_00056 [Syntrophorhabdus sp. PtaB.Bin184]|jgi:hypothetical protein|nr:MAG: hypothetical protein A4E61_00056 [Syntrophorhabdus sp. PtaB.Bin184]